MLLSTLKIKGKLWIPNPFFINPWWTELWCQVGIWKTRGYQFFKNIIYFTVISKVPCSWWICCYFLKYLMEYVIHCKNVMDLLPITDDFNKMFQLHFSWLPLQFQAICLHRIMHDMIKSSSWLLFRVISFLLVLVVCLLLISSEAYADIIQQTHHSY